MFKLVLEKAEEPKIKLPTSAGSSKKQESSRKISISAFLAVAKAFDCVDHNKLWKILKEEYQTTWPASWETYMQVRKQQLELDMEQQTGSKQEKEYIKAVYCNLYAEYIMRNVGSIIVEIFSMFSQRALRPCISVKSWRKKMFLKLVPLLTI